jgi:hypothetical protein
LRDDDNDNDNDDNDNDHDGDHDCNRCELDENKVREALEAARSKAAQSPENDKSGTVFYI